MNGAEIEESSHHAAPGGNGSSPGDTTSGGTTSAGRKSGDAPAPDLPVLAEPRDGVPAVTDTPSGLAEVADSLGGATGPVAVDAERASGFRYGQRAFLVQLRREGAGTVLIDPEVLGDLSPIDRALDGAEWILHAATQDLPCLADTGMKPSALFDTELAARLLDWPKVGLASVVERVVGVRLKKEHSAVDWSTRPLPDSWLRYAALDVEVLIDVRNHLQDELDKAGKSEWAHEEFVHLLDFTPPTHPDPWRRTSGMHTLHQPEELAAVRALWQAREDYARETDTAPGRIIPDSAIVAAAKGAPKSKGALLRLPGFRGRASKSQASRWLEALHSAGALEPDDQATPSGSQHTTPPPRRVWAKKRPIAAARLAAAKTAINELAQTYSVPAENLLTPSVWRTLCWEPPRPLDEAAIDGMLTTLGARHWQRELAVRPLTRAIAEAEEAHPADG